MILILTSSNDESTHDVMQWIYHLSPKTKIVRINECDKIQHVTVSSNNIVLKFKRQFYDDIEVDFSKISYYWYRKQDLDIYKFFLKSFENNYLNRYQKEELDILLEYLHYYLSKIKHIGSFLNGSLNKLIVNSMAMTLGLQVPKLTITSEVKDLIAFSKSCDNKIITKAISEAITLKVEEEILIGYTESVELDDLKPNQDILFPSLLQNKVEKLYELRIFYLEGIFEAMAIFSQRDNQTETDFRKYNYEKPNRNVPYNLPESIKEKLRLLFNQLGLNTGSVDMIVDKQGQYLFLEINPVGQFGMVSVPNNCFIEKRIAETLLS
jgi:ATP-GRASP peptide maturase of grasp-with-spasm system